MTDPPRSEGRPLRGGDGVQVSAFTAVVPARNEQELLPATLSALAHLAEVTRVIVVDDASTDGTGRVALDGGAQVVRRDRSDGKAGALMAGTARALEQDGAAGLVFLDADVGETGTGLAALLTAVSSGQADLAIAQYAARGPGGGKGRVVRMAQEAIRAQSGWTPEVPLSGIRAMTPAAYRAVHPLARGWGVEVAMTLDALGAGLRVIEVPTTLTHRATGRGWRGRLHRGRQYLDARRAITARRRASDVGPRS